MGITETTPHCMSLLNVVRTMGNHALRAQHEQHFLDLIAQVLLEHVRCDAVIVRLLERHIQTRVVATKSGIHSVAPDTLWEPFTEQDQEQWLNASRGRFCPDVGMSPFVKPRFRGHLLQLGLQAALLVPLVRDGELCGQVVFGWLSAPQPDDVDLDYFHGLADVTCLQLTAFNLRRAGEFDPLTGLLNRRGLERYWRFAEQQEPGALLFMDLDGLKLLNDARGYLAGDDYLRNAARRLLSVIPGNGSLCRYGGDEFVVLAPGMTRPQAEQLVSVMKEQFRQLGDEIPPPKPNITVGVAICPDDGTDVQSLLKRADENMYTQKRRNAALTLVKDVPERQAQLPEGMFEGWLETWPDGILVTDPDLKVIYVNRAYETMTGYTLAEWIGKTPAFVGSGKTSPRTYQLMWRDMNDVGSWTGQLINRRPNGDEWVAFISIVKIIDRDGRHIGYLGNTRDISHSLWAGKTDMRAPFQEAFTQETLAFALAEAGQMHEGGSREHLERIRDLTQLLVLGAADRDYEHLQRYETRTAIILSSILHDIGKLAVPEGLLRKPGQLTPEEYNLVKTHTIAGERLLRSPYLDSDLAAPPSEFLSMAAAIARSHHEWWDGSGYPDGLAGEDIPLAARIVGIADVYDALRGRRPYKESWSHDDTVDYIVAGAGKQFDPDLVTIFVAVADEFAAVFEQAQDDSRARERSQKRGGDKDKVG